MENATVDYLAVVLARHTNLGAIGSTIPDPQSRFQSYKMGGSSDSSRIVWIAGRTENEVEGIVTQTSLVLLRPLTPIWERSFL
jgi:hypothetical protein